MKKRLGSILLAVSILVSLLTPTANASSGTRGTCGTNLTWVLSDSGTLTISGSGSMYDYDSPSDSPFYLYITLIDSIVISEGVTHIGDYAFSCCGSSYLTDITLPDSVVSIGQYAFYACKATNIVLGDSLTEIDDYAFSYCTNLTSITIPGSVKSIGTQPFDGCTKLSSVTIESGVTEIVDYMFSGCTALSAVSIPYTVECIGSYAFYKCTNLSSITIPDSVTTIGDYAFHNCSNLTSITLSSNLETIGTAVFWDCTSLSSVTIPGSLTTLGAMSFYNCTGLKSITLEEGLVTIGNSAFYGCTSLTDVVIPDGVSTIDAGAFSDCTSLSSITIPDSVATIAINAFNGCSSLSTVYYGGSEEDWATVSIGSNNEALVDANIIYAKESTGTDPDSETDDTDEEDDTSSDNVESNSEGTDSDSNITADTYSDHTYLLIDLSMTWKEAKEYCESVGGHLATITSEEEEAYIESLIAEYGTKYVYWLGGTDEVEEGTWVWITGEEWSFNLGIFDDYSAIDDASEDYLSIDAGASYWNDMQNGGDSSGDRNWINTGFICEWDETIDLVDTGVICTVDLYDNGTLINTQSVIKGFTISISGLEEPTREGYVFIGWIDSDGNSVTGDITVTSNIELSAVWEAESEIVQTFSDVEEGSWYYNAVYWAAENGITNGTSTTTFSPNDPVTRAQLVTFLYRASGSPSVEGVENPFTDVNAVDYAYYYDAIIWAYSESITTGKNTSETFCPDDIVTRQEIVTFLYRYYGEPPVDGLVNVFTDVADGMYYTDAVLWAYDRGVTTGVSETELAFDPTGTCTRAQFVTFLYRAETNI